jgi:hypothetical protein
MANKELKEIKKFCKSKNFNDFDKLNKYSKELFLKYSNIVINRNEIEKYNEFAKRIINYNKVVNIKKVFLKDNNRYPESFESFVKWENSGKKLYIGRNMNFYVEGTLGSKWQNPFQVKTYGIENSLLMYKYYIINTALYNQLPELRNYNELGCWCHPNKCHGDILIKLLEKYPSKPIINLKDEKLKEIVNKKIKY